MPISLWLNTKKILLNYKLLTYLSSFIYFISQNSKNMSITRGEIKNNVHMTYKDVIMDSQYNEIDIAKNTILARDKVMIDLKNHTKLTANFVWFDMNKGEGHAEKI